MDVGSAMRQKILFTNLRSYWIEKRVIELWHRKCFIDVNSLIMERLIASTGLKAGILRCLKAVESTQNIPNRERRTWCGESVVSHWNELRTSTSRFAMRRHGYYTWPWNAQQYSENRRFWPKNEGQRKEKTKFNCYRQMDLILVGNSQSAKQWKFRCVLLVDNFILLKVNTRQITWIIKRSRPRN